MRHCPWSVSRFALLVAALTAFVPLTPAEKNSANRALASEERLKKDIFFLASDECEGRGVATKGINKAAEYIAGEFKKAGLKPAAGRSDYFQPFDLFTGASKMEGTNTLKLTGPNKQEIELKLEEQFRPIGLSETGTVAAPVVFVGYGVTADKLGYDDYKDMNVAGKVVVILRKIPRAENSDAPFDGGPNSSTHAALASKLVNAGLHKAAAVLFVNDRSNAKTGDALMDFAYTAGSRQTLGLPAVHVRRAVVDDMLKASTNLSLKEREADIDNGLKPQSVALTGWTAALEVNVQREKRAVKNIVGVLEGAGPHAEETVVIGAHYDHLGYGGRGTGSLSRDQKEPTIHHGADDNGSGTTTIMELARRFGEMPNRQGRRLVFMAFTGEEMGLLGSDHYCKDPLIPLEKTVAMVNLDMVGRLRPDVETKKDKIFIYGTGTSKEFDGQLTELNKKYDFQMQKVAGTRMAGGSSDHASFYAKKIPVIFFFTGNHPDYHRPTDTADKINVPGMRKVADFSEELIEQLAAEDQAPVYVAVNQPSPGRPAGGGGPRLGIMPSYGDEKEGVLLEGVSPGQAAEKAGLKEGDRILELGGKPVKNLEAYMVLMATFKKGDTLDVVVRRGGNKESIKVKLE
jgi:hypothetical protein